MSLLRDPSEYEGLRPMSRHSQALQVWAHPAFDPYISWTLYCIRRRREQDQFWIRRVVWDQRGDPSNGLTIKDPIASDGQLQTDVAKKLIDGLGDLKADALFPTSNRIGLDGITYGIKSGSHMCHTEVSWWCDPPKEWYGVLEFFVNATECLNRSLPKSALNVDFSRYLAD